jgi:hypothetical protein
MTPPIDIAAIRARLNYEGRNYDPATQYHPAVADLRAALDEIERLRQDVVEYQKPMARDVTCRSCGSVVRVEMSVKIARVNP